MALSAPPAPPNPSPSAVASSGATATTTTATRPLYSNSRPPLTVQPHPFPPQPQRFPSNQNPIYSQLAPPQLQSTLYSVSSSGRGYISGPAVPCPPPNQNNYVTRPAVGYATSIPPFGVSANTDPGSGPGLGFVRPSNLTHASVTLANSTANAGTLIPVVVQGFPVSSAHQRLAPAKPSFGDLSGSKDGRDRSKDDSLSVVRDRKVRLTDTASLYTLCRSWLRNGFPEDTQPQYMDAEKSLPKPLAVESQDAQSPEKKEDIAGQEEDDVSLEHLSTEKLLQMHVKRAKKIRSRLREERLKRIARYKTRLGLLLPPMVDQTQHTGG
ncbi:unnamed protein product [Cuscuta campestris]|uniref:Uncharacterized protein n=1 Tax=Cuscuta campestris TaxID=132261 RepID=A0A484NMQ0_9ASTE|nr:unnamed protein product [Cuscuta campestris]